MAFTHHNNYDAVELKAASVSGVRAIAGYLLRFSVEYVVHVWRSEWGNTLPTFHNVIARVDLGDTRIRLGTAIPEVPLVLTPAEYPRAAAILFELFISNSHVEELERLRAGGDLEFVVRFSGERLFGSTYATVYAESRCKAGQSEWIGVLEAMGYGHFLLCELPIHFGANGELSQVWKALSHAGRQIDTGNYNAAVADCRRAIEAMLKISGLAPALALVAEKRRTGGNSMSKAERMLNILDAARHATHLSVHVDSERELVEYSRDEALLIYGAAASSIRDIAARLANGSSVV